MQLRLIVVGRGDADLAAAEAEYLKRLHRYAPCRIQELQESRARQRSQRLQEEARRIRRRAGTNYILFDVHGRCMNSREWAQWLSRQRGDAHLPFVIGGPDGVAAEVRQAAREVWSLSPLTLPHRLVRLLVLEQLYRASTIVHGHPYHRA